MSKPDNLFQEFDIPSKSEWIAKVEKDLKGKPLSDLQWQLNEQIQLAPFYHESDQITSANINRGIEHNDWLIGEDFRVLDAAALNKQLLDALENGVNAPRFIFEEMPSMTTLELLFDKVIPTYIHSTFRLQGDAADQVRFLQLFHEYCLSLNHQPTGLQGTLDYFAANNNDLLKVSKAVQELFPAFKWMAVDGSDLSCESSEAVDFLRTILSRTDTVFQSIEKEQVSSIRISIPIGKSYFVEIAKIRALHILWTNLLSAYEVPQTPLCLDAFISANAYDEQTNTNMIRSMTIAMSAVIGGVDRLTILPADLKGDAFARRIARNVQHLLKMESYMDRVIDPAAGSYYIEELTRRLVDEAWKGLGSSQ